MKLFILVFLPFILYANEPFFTLFDPPKGWLFTDPSKYEKGVKIGLIESKRRIFTPSISLALEKIGNASLEDYSRALEKIYRCDQFTKLGTFKTSAGIGHIFQIDKKSQWGEIRLLQGVIIHEGYALILTGTSLKREFLEVHETFLNAFKTLQVYPTLTDSCPDERFKEKIRDIVKCWNKYSASSKDNPKTLFTSSFFQDNWWKPFANYIEKDLNNMGACWQFLALRHIQETLLTENES